MDRHGWTELMHCARLDRDDRARELLAEGARPELRAVDGATACHIAARWSSLAVMRRLLAQRVPGRPLHLRQDERGYVPLMYAVESGSVHAADLLLRWDGPGHDEVVPAAMRLAVALDLPSVVARLVDPHDWQSETHWVLADRARPSRSIGALSGFRVFARAVIGARPWRVLVRAISAGVSATVVGALLDAGAQPNVPDGCDDTPPIAAAVIAGNAPVITALARAGAVMDGILRPGHDYMRHTLAQLVVHNAVSTSFGHTAHLLTTLLAAGCSLDGAYTAAQSATDPLRMRLLHLLCTTLRRDPFARRSDGADAPLVHLASGRGGKHLHCVLENATWVPRRSRQWALDAALAAAVRANNCEGAVVLMEHGAAPARLLPAVPRLLSREMARELMWRGLDVPCAAPPWPALARHAAARRLVAARQRLALARGAAARARWDDDVVQTVAARRAWRRAPCTTGCRARRATGRRCSRRARRPRCRATARRCRPSARPRRGAPPLAPSAMWAS